MEIYKTMENMRFNENDALTLRDLLGKIDDELNSLYFSDYRRYVEAISDEDVDFKLMYIQPLMDFLDLKTNVHYSCMFITSFGGCAGILFMGFDNGTLKKPFPILFEDLEKLSNNELIKLFQ